ncbi:hypothetical protein ACRAWD_11885 [Caulobacter segnis]
MAGFGRGRARRGDRRPAVDRFRRPPRGPAPDPRAADPRRRAAVAGGSQPGTGRPGAGARSRGRPAAALAGPGRDVPRRRLRPADRRRRSGQAPPACIRCSLARGYRRWLERSAGRSPARPATWSGPPTS